MMSLTNVNIRCEEENAKRSSLAAARSFDDCNTRALLFDARRRGDDGGSAYALPFFFRYKKCVAFFSFQFDHLTSHFKRIYYSHVIISKRKRARTHVLLLYSKLDETNTNAERTTIIALSSSSPKKKKVVVVVSGQKKKTKRRG